MFTEIFIVEVPHEFDDLGSGGQRTKHRASVIENLPHFFIELFACLIQVNRERHIRLARTVLAHVLRLFIKAGVDRVVFVPSDETSGPGILSIRKPSVNSGYVLLTDLAGPGVLVPLAMSIHFKQVPDKFASDTCTRPE